LGVKILSQLHFDVINKFSYLWKDLIRMGLIRSRLISIPINISRLMPMEPFGKPFLGSSHFSIYRDRIFVLKKLFDSYLSQCFFLHWITRWVGFTVGIIKQFQPKGNPCPDIKTDIKGELCSDTWHLGVIEFKKT